jgi:hypothetical protein
LSHRYLSFLQPKLGIQLLLTTNFDSLLERAFYQESIPIKVFDVHRNAELPDAALVCRQLSLLKLHGSAYGLSFCDRLKYKLDTDSRNNALAFIPKDALMLVIGFNGSERRIMQMFHAIVQERGCGDYKPRLIWIQGPGEPGPLFNDLLVNNTENVQRVDVKHMDTFIQELYFHITNSYQSSAIAYSIIPSRPLVSGLKPFPFGSEDEKERKRRSVQLCIAEIKEGKKSSNWSSLAGMAFVNSLDGYTVIWIDIENHHTVEGIIAEIFNRVRVVDPQAPSCAMTNMDDNANATSNAISKAVERILDVFKRGRYVLVLDLVESFGRPQMVHHGMISSDKKNEEINEEIFERRVKNFNSFLRKLLGYEGKNNYWDSYVVVTADMPRLRHSSIDKISFKDSPASYQAMYTLVKSLQDDYKKHNHINISPQKTNNENQNAYGYDDLIIKNEFKPFKNPLNRLQDHWQPSKTVISNTDAENRSLKRTKNILSLLEILREESKSESIQAKVEKLSKAGVTDAFICTLSIFRRPRPLPLLRAFIERWGLHQIGIHNTDDEKNSSITHDTVDEKNSSITHQAISKLLQLLETNSSIDGNKSPVGVALQNHEGGIIWLFREFYEATYDALTENIHRQAWLDAFKSNAELSISAAIMDGCLSITWHLSAARAYYVDVFLATHDIRAFWEYLYHRVSAIRTITLLIAIIKNKSPKNTIWADLNQHCKDLPSMYTNLPKGEFKEGEYFVWYVWVLGVFDPIKQDKEIFQDPANKELLSNEEKLVEYFELLRKNSLNTLLMALNKNKLLLRTVAAPDSVLAWSRQFLASELNYMEKIQPPNNDDSNNSELPTINELREFFTRLELQALRSKMNYNATRA